MEFIQFLIDFILHVDAHIAELIQYMGVWTYVILFLIIFAETGLVVTPFLPGDSLLFALGAFCADEQLNLPLILVLLSVAAILGDALNYMIGKRIGPRIFKSESSRYLNKQHLQRTHDFYEKYGGKTIIVARFMPIIRTFAPFVAGIGSMGYTRFAMYNIVGGIVWIASFVLLGFWFGNVPVVKQNRSFIMIAIVFISIAPGVIEYFRQRKGAQRKAEQTP